MLVHIILIANVALDWSEADGRSSEDEYRSHPKTVLPNLCEVELKINLKPKPPDDYKASTLSTHHVQSPVISVGSYQWVQLECTCCCDQDRVKKAAARAVYDQLRRENLENHTSIEHSDLLHGAPGQLQYRIQWSNQLIIKIRRNKKDHVHLRRYQGENTNQGSKCDEAEASKCMEIYQRAQCVGGEHNATSVGLRNNQGFYIYGEKLGMTQLTVSLVWVNKSVVAQDRVTIEDEMTEENVMQNTTTKLIKKQMKDYRQMVLTTARIFTPWQEIVRGRRRRGMDGNQSTIRLEYYYSNQTVVEGLWKENIHITIILRPQKYYVASEWGAIIIGSMIALSVGCCNDPAIMLTYLKRPKVLVIGMSCQLFVGPVIALIVGICLQLDVDKAFGLFATTVVPGGGLAYLLTYLVKGDRRLSAVLSLMTSWANIVTAPMWFYLVGWFWFDRPMHMGKAVAWLTIIAGTETLGTVVRGLSPNVAFALLTWVTRPLLLLSGILMITLGAYINHYAFNEFSQNLIIGLVCVITICFVLGWILGQTDDRPQQPELATAKTLATECTVFNGLLCMPLLRITVHAPQGDLAAVAPMWAILLTITCLVYHAIASILHRWLTDYKQRRRKKNAENEQQVQQQQQQAMLGSRAGATSMAAVGAAAIAVAPTISVRKNGKSPTENRNQNTYSLIGDRSNATTDDIDPVYFTAGPADDYENRSNKAQLNNSTMQPNVVKNNSQFSFPPPSHPDYKHGDTNSSSSRSADGDGGETCWKSFFEDEKQIETHLPRCDPGNET